MFQCRDWGKGVGRVVAQSGGVTDPADKVQSSGGSVEAESDSVEDEASLSSQLDDDGQFVCWTRTLYGMCSPAC